MYVLGGEGIAALCARDENHLHTYAMAKSRQTYPAAAFEESTRQMGRLARGV